MRLTCDVNNFSSGTVGPGGRSEEDFSQIDGGRDETKRPSPVIDGNSGATCRAYLWRLSGGELHWTVKGRRWQAN